jgi:hypothetical protein
VGTKLDVVIIPACVLQQQFVPSVINATAYCGRRGREEERGSGFMLPSCILEIVTPSAPVGPALLRYISRCQFEWSVSDRTCKAIPVEFLKPVTVLRVNWMYCSHVLTRSILFLFHPALETLMLSEEAQYAEEGLVCKSLIVRLHIVLYFVSSSAVPKPARMPWQNAIHYA